MKEPLLSNNTIDSNAIILDDTMSIKDDIWVTRGIKSISIIDGYYIIKFHHSSRKFRATNDIVKGLIVRLVTLENRKVSTPLQNLHKLTQSFLEFEFTSGQGGDCCFHFRK